MLTADSNRHKKKFALMVIDIDNFKNINDNYSHSVGDEILIKASKRIESLLRSTDSIARIGGDEFVLLVSEINTPKDAEMVAAKILVSFNEKIKSSDLEIRISLSMGIAIYPDNGLSLEELFRKADSAMYFVKESGRNNFSFYK
jgi:diguanylate cyclase (GGDEF)-like protein